MSVLKVLGIVCGVLFASSMIYAEDTITMCTKTHVDSAIQEVKEKLDTLYERADNETDAAMIENAAFFDTTAQALDEAKKSCPDQNTTSLATILRRLKQCAQSFSKRGKEGCSAKCQALEDQSQFNYVIRQKVVDGPSFEQAVKCARAFSSAEQKARLYRALSLDATKFPSEKGDALFNTVKEALSTGKVSFNDKDKIVMKSALKTIVAKTYLSAPENATCPGLIKKLAEYDEQLASEALVELAQEFNKSHKHDEAIALLGRVSCLHLQMRGYLALLDSLEHAQDAEQTKTALVFPVYIGMTTPLFNKLDEDLRAKAEKLYNELPEAARNVFKKAETCIPHDYFVTSNDTETTADSSVVFLRNEERDYSNLREYKFVPKPDGKVMQIKHKGALGGYVYLPSDTELIDLDSIFSQGEKIRGEWEPADDGYFCDNNNENSDDRPVCIAPSEDITKVNQSELLDELKNKYIKEYTDKRQEKCPK